MWQGFELPEHVWANHTVVEHELSVAGEWEVKVVPRQHR